MPNGKAAKIKALEADIAFLRAANESQAVQVDVMTDAMIDMKKSIDVYTAACNHKLDRAGKWIRTQDSSALEYLDLENATEPEHPTPVRDLHVERMKMRKPSLKDSFQGQVLSRTSPFKDKEKEEIRCAFLFNENHRFEL